MARFLPMLLLSATGTALSVETIDFNRDVRPILTKNCTTCHGGVKKAGDVSYLYREDTLGEGESGKTIVVPGDPNASEMIKRITTTDPDDRMPPPKHHPKPLPKEEIETLTRWIEQGAVWGKHWSFQKPEKSPAPEVKQADWPRQELDQFILARLEAEGLEPSPPASPEEWLRRASLDLTGLPPTIEEYETFQAALDADTEKAYADVADRLLTSPAYGEHWASMWLDLARYSDTFGFEKDPHRDIWPYRDWVIKAFNADMSFADFTIKQLAGDLVESPQPGDLIATAFHRNTQNNTEGGTDDEEWRMAAVIDRVNTTWTAWNATTFGCVQCHSHPYDPIAHEDYYEFMAFFNNTEDVDINSDFPRTKVANDPSEQGEVVRLEKEIRSQREALNRSALKVARDTQGWKPLKATLAKVHPDTGQLTQNEQHEFVTSGTTPTRSRLEIAGEPGSFAAIKVGLLPLSDNPAEWDEQGAMISELTVELSDPQGKRERVQLREVVSDFLAGPYDPNEAIKTDSLKDIRPTAPGWGEFPMMKTPRTAWFVPNEPVTVDPGTKVVITIHHAASCNGDNQNTVLRRFTIDLTDDATLANHIASVERSRAWKALDDLKKSYSKIQGRTIPTLVERGEGARRPTRIFIRGNRTTLDRLVDPAIPDLFDSPKQTENRLDMAKWLMGDDNPLAARTLANRLWAQLFGNGIVATLGDFGSSGALPTHPELLDHLALRLKNDHQWHIKPFLKELVLSSTYRQANRATADLLTKDPRNQLLGRGPRNRLTAEMVRDQALLVSGLISTKSGGPPVYPPQPEGIWNSVYSGAKWKTSTGEDRYRRAIYTYNKRTAGYPSFLTFDGGARDVCLPQRVTTNTPLQALVTLNDPAHIEFARAFATRMKEAGPDLHAQLAHGYRLITLRDATPAVIDTLASLHADAEQDYASSPAEASKLGATPSEAALVLVANTLLNSDVALNR